MAGVERPLDPATMARIARAQRLINERVAGVSKAATETYEGALEKYLPLHLRTFGMTVLGDRSPITEANLTANERKRLGRIHVPRTGTPMRDGSTMHSLTAYGSNDAPIQNTFGSFGLKKMPDGSAVVVDSYDFHKDGEPKVPNAPIMDRISGLGQLVMQGISSMQRPENPYAADPGDEIPNMVINGASRPVRIRLTREEIAASGKGRRNSAMVSELKNRIIETEGALLAAATDMDKEYLSDLLQQQKSTLSKLVE